MKNLIDVVNFNSDASCLPSDEWLKILKGGSGSFLIKWLKVYVSLKKKVVLGFPGATVADIASSNPEAIRFINSHPQIFEIILRPFAHDIALLRSEDGFVKNFEIGRKVIENEFKHISPYFLPPEFMLTNSQVFKLTERNVSGVFINPARFSPRIRSRIPVDPYMVKTFFGKSIKCIPFKGDLSFSYLDALHKYDCGLWNRNLLSCETRDVFTWRDGESMLFVPEGLKREEYWLKNEDKKVQRKHLKELPLKFTSHEQLSHDLYKSYPVHSFSAWMKELRMLGYINKVSQIEESLTEMSDSQLYMWLAVINSDILSAIEKQEPVIQIRRKELGEITNEWTIHRSERGFEGEEYLALLKSSLKNKEVSTYIRTSRESHISRFRQRINYLSRLNPLKS